VPIQIDPQLAQLLRKMKAQIAALERRPRTITEEIDAIDGRRIYYTMIGTQDFTIDQEGTRGQSINMLVSQDGPFIETHYPLVMWRSSAPSNATDFGRWRPVSSWPLPDQVLDTNIIDISYEVVDGGSQRNFQQAAVPAGLLSRPDNMIPLPVPTLFTPNTTVQFYPTYENILFDDDPPTTEQGTLVVALPGYRIVNL
jgi:hypothetical protein